MIGDMLRKAIVSAVLTIPIGLYSSLGHALGFRRTLPFGISESIRVRSDDARRTVGWLGLSDERVATAGRYGGRADRGASHKDPNPQSLQDLQYFRG